MVRAGCWNRDGLKMTTERRIIQAAAGAGGGEIDYGYLAFPQAKENYSSNHNNYLSLADVEDPQNMTMAGGTLLSVGSYNTHTWGITSDPINKVVFLSSKAGDLIHAINVPSLSTIWSKVVTNSKALVHDNENQILYYVNGYSTLTAVDATDGTVLGALSLTGRSMDLDQIFSAILVDDNTRLVLIQAYVSDAAEKCVMTVDVSDVTAMSVDATQALDIYGSGYHGIEWDVDNEIVWVNAYYDTKVYGLTKSGSGWAKTYSITTAAQPISMTFAPDLGYVFVGCSGELQGWNISNLSSITKDYSNTTRREYGLSYDPSISTLYGTRTPYSTSWGITSFDFSGSLSSPTVTQFANLGTPYTTYTAGSSYVSVLI